MDTDGGDHPGDDLNCHLFLSAYLRCASRGRRAFLRL